MQVKLLRRGQRGTLVRKWQTFLRGQGFAVTVTGVFDAATEKGTRAFQAEHKLTVDGIVGNESFGKAMSLGFELVDFTGERNSGWPREPKFPPLTSTTERQSVFGRFRYVADPQPGNMEGIRILDNWEARNIVRVKIPQLVGVTGASRSGNVSFHRLAAEQLAGLWGAWEDAGLLDRVLTYAGSYNPRFIRGSRTTLSNHAFGTAFDINAAWNRLGTEPAWPGEQGCLFELVPIAHKWGFYWGGHFRRRDGMHFEVAKLI